MNNGNNGLPVVVVTPVRTMEQRSDHALHVLSSSLGTMMRIEAAIWTAKRGIGGIAIQEFYSMSKSHEYFGWQGRNVVNNETNASSSELDRLHKVVDQFTEEEVLLFEFVTITGWKPDDTRLYSLYNLTLSPKGKIYLNVLQRPEEITTIFTRSEILSKMYHLSCKNFANKTMEMNNWWEHVANVAQMILNHRASITATPNKVHDKSLKHHTADHNHDKLSSNATKKSVDTTNMNLEERVRARSLNNPANSTSTQPLKAGASTLQIESKALLELAISLRSFSQRRGASGRLTVRDLITDANITWKSVVNYTNSLNDNTSGKIVGVSGGGGSGGINSLVNVDLSRVLFLLRLKMKTCAGITDKRQMESQLIELLQKLATAVPEWLQLRQLRNTKLLLSGGGTLNEQEKRGVNSCQESIIVIRNDCVDYADVRAKLGGRIYNLIPDSTKINDGSNNLTSRSNNGNKRSLFEMRQEQAVGVADARVPDSFRRLYGKALEDPNKDGK